MHGSLFTQDFIEQGIRGTAAWRDLDPVQFAAFTEELQRIHSNVGGDTTLNEAQTEVELIMPVLQALGWHLLPQQQTNARGRADVPDALLFTSADARQAALDEPRPDKRFRHGNAIVESKRWLRPLDRGNAGNRLEIDTPSSQMLRYLSQAEIASDRAVNTPRTTSPRSPATSVSTARHSSGMPRTAATAWPGSMHCSCACTVWVAMRPATSSTPSRSSATPTNVPSAATAPASWCWAT